MCKYAPEVCFLKHFVASNGLENGTHKNPAIGAQKIDLEVFRNGFLKTFLASNIQASNEQEVSKKVFKKPDFGFLCPKSSSYSLQLCLNLLS